MNNSDDDDGQRPVAPETVHCNVCQKELPPDLAVALEGEDYRLWFCSNECYVQWQHRTGDAAKE